jgi:tungstate transport system substrate-binding protein
MRIRHVAFVAIVALLTAAGPSWGKDQSLVVASTTSAQDSGLFGHILPLFKAKTGIAVKVIALGSGEALDAGRRGDADLVFVHAKAKEEQFVAEGFGRTGSKVISFSSPTPFPCDNGDRHQNSSMRVK